VRVSLSFVLPVVRTFFLCDFFGAYHIFSGQDWAEGKGELATCPRADSGREPDKMYAAIVQAGRMRVRQNKKDNMYAGRVSG